MTDPSYDDEFTFRDDWIRSHYRGFHNGVGSAMFNESFSFAGKDVIYRHRELFRDSVGPRVFNFKAIGKKI
jgi:hypothetical protein